MKRTNSRNQQSSTQNFSQGQPVYGTQAFSRQAHNLNDFHKSSTQKKEINLLMEELDLPNESLTISSLSQSPFQARNTMLNGTQGESNENEGTLGRSELEHTYNDTSKSLSITRRNDPSDNQQTSQSYIEEEEENEDSRYRTNQTSEETEGFDHSKYNPNRNKRQAQTQHERHRNRSDNSRQKYVNNTSDLEESKSVCGRDSPDFNRHYDQQDDLTISNTVISNADVSHRGYSDNLSKLASNRTFADSVKNQAHSSSSNTNRRGNNFIAQRKYKQGGHDETTSSNQLEDSDDIQERDSEDEQDRSKNSCDLSGIDSFAQTAIRSPNQPYRQQHFPKVKAPSIDLTDDGQSMSMKRSPLPNRFQNMENDESLSMTPNSQLDGQWMFSQKSIGGKNSRTTDSDFNVMNRLQTNLPNMLQNNSEEKVINSGRQGPYNMTQILTSNRHQRSRDAELEQALEEESQQNMIRQTLTNSRETDDIIKRVNAKEIPELKKEMAKWKTEYLVIQQQSHQNAEILEETNNELVAVKNALSQMQIEFRNQEHAIELLKKKYKDNSKLPELRGVQLQKSINEVKQLNKIVLDKDKIIKSLQSKLNQLESEDRSQHAIMQENYNQLVDENYKQKIFIEANKRKNTQNQSEFNSQKQDIEQKAYAQFQKYDLQIQQLKNEIQNMSQDKKSFDKLINKAKKDRKNIEGELLQKDDIISQLERALEDLSKQKEIEISQIHAQTQKYQNDAKGYKQRCKELEQEFENIKGGAENQSIFGNSTLNHTSLAVQSQMNQTNQNRKLDFEIKKIKEVYDEKLNKLSSQNQNLKNTNTEFENKIKKLELEEQSRKKQSYQVSDQFAKEQELINEIRSLKEKNQQSQDFNFQLRELLGLQEKNNSYHTKDIVDSIHKITVQVEEMTVLENEYEKLKTQLSKAQQRELELIEQQNNQSRVNLQESQASIKDNNPSQFTKNLLLSKDSEIQKLRTLIEQDKGQKQQSEDKIWQLENSLNDFKQQNQQLIVQIENISEELQRVRESKESSDRNVVELKEKLRTLIREQQQQSNLIGKQKPSNTLDEVEKKKYEDLISAILILDLVQDPLQSVNISLQDSYIDEFEQAIKHLEEQKRLVTDSLSHLNQAASQHKNLVTQIQNEVKEKQIQIDNLKKEYQKQVLEIREKDRIGEVQQVEMGELTQSLERLKKQLFEAEKGNERIRQEYEQQKLDIKKLMRTQEHLFKDQKKPAAIVNESIKDNKSISLTEHERIQMLLEDQISNLQSQINDKNIELKSAKQGQKPPIVVDQSVDILRVLDQLIESKEKLPLFNQTAVELQKRIEKIRIQEQNKIVVNQQKLTSSIHENKLTKSLRQEIEINANDQDQLIESVGKWLKQSQIDAPSNLSKGFIQDDNNGSLFFSDLVTNQMNQINGQSNNGVNHEYELTISNLREQINSLTIKLEEANYEKQNTSTFNLESKSILDDLIFQNKQLKEEVKVKEQLLRECEDQYKIKQKQMEQDLAHQGQQIWRDVENLKEQIKEELNAKAQSLEQEYQDLEQTKQKNKDILNKQQQELNKNMKARQDEQEQEFVQRVKVLEREIKMASERSQEEQMTTLCQQLEESHQSKLKQISQDNNNILTQFKQDHSKSIEDLKKKKDREIKQVKEEIEQQRKTFEDKIRKTELEFKLERDTLEREHKEKVDSLKSKNKQESKDACDKVRAQLKNQIDSVKNEMAKQKAQFELDKKKLVSDHSNESANAEREQNERLIQEKKQLMNKLEYEYKVQIEKLEQEFKLQKDKVEQIWKKKIDEKEKEMYRKAEEGEEEISKIKDSHKEELRKEKERIEMRMKEQIRTEVKIQVQIELEEEFQDQLMKVVQQQQIEIDKIKSKYEVLIREERASQMPILNQSRTVEIQCNTEEPHQVQREMLATERQSEHNMSIYSNESYIEQLKQNFEDELDRQQAVFKIQLTQNQVENVQIFQQIVILEFDKILQSIQFKSIEGASVQEFEIKKKNINNLINNILARKDDQKENQMKSSLNVIRNKIAQILKEFKTEVERKLQKKFDQQKTQQNLKERLKIPNMSDIISNRSQQNILSSPTSSIEQDNSSDYSQNSQQPTPRDLGEFLQPTPDKQKMQSAQPYQQKEQQADFSKYLIQNQSPNHHLSDVKKYTEIIDENQQDQILKKIGPVPNAKGVLVVEISKVVRDLQEIYNSMKQAKFYRLLQADQNQINENDTKAQSGDYRLILNDFFRMIVKLNAGVDSLSNKNEILKQKLINGQLKEQICLLSQQIQNQNSNSQVEQILNYYGNKQNNSQETSKCLQALEQTQFSINKLQFKLYQVVDLFTETNQESGKETLNTNGIEVDQKCREYSRNSSAILETQLNQDLLASQCSPDKLTQIKISPELLSPEETAQLIAAVFSKMNQTQPAHLNNQLDTYQSFFQTFFSNDDNIKGAENFITKYREQLNHTQKNSNIPLQMNNEYYQTQHLLQNQKSQQAKRMNHTSVQSNCPIGKKRSRSQQNTNIFSTKSTSIPSQYVSNVFQQNLLERNNSINSNFNPILISNYETQSNQQNLNRNQSLYQNINQDQNEQWRNPYGIHARSQAYQGRSELNIDELSNAQSNVNNLFEKMRANFQSTNLGTFQSIDSSQ